MRPKERIPIFLGHIRFQFLEERWGIDMPNSLISRILDPNQDVRKYWEENYDQRFGQMLINLCVIPDHFHIWMDEDLKILLDQGCNPRDVVLWGSIYDENHKPLDKIKYRLVRDMDTNHIQSILKDIEERKYNLPKDYIIMFTDELNYRKSKEYEKSKANLHNVGGHA